MSGTTLQGVVHLNDVLMLGPDSTGGFQPLPVKSIHRKRMPVKEVRAGQTASFSLKKVGSLDTRCFYRIIIHLSIYLIFQYHIRLFILSYYKMSYSLYVI